MTDEHSAIGEVIKRDASGKINAIRLGLVFGHALSPAAE
jgi:hypothetical protein